MPFDFDILFHTTEREALQFYTFIFTNDKELEIIAYKDLLYIAADKDKSKSISTYVGSLYGL